MVKESFHVKQNSYPQTAILYRVHVTAILPIKKLFCSFFTVSERVTGFKEVSYNDKYLKKLPFNASRDRSGQLSSFYVHCTIKCMFKHA
jgi:hypothetical protein